MFSTDEDSSIKKTCRICLSDDECLDESNLFFISPCECKGSCKFVHFACLQSWINSKIVEKSHGNTTNYLWKRFECEVCEKQYPKHIIYGGKKFNLLDIKLPQGPYLLLENISREKKKSKGITIIKSSPNETKLVSFFIYLLLKWIREEDINAIYESQIYLSQGFMQSSNMKTNSFYYSIIIQSLEHWYC